MTRNEWIVMREDPVVAWEALIPLPPGREAKLEVLFAIAETVLAAGAATQVMRLATVDDDGGDQHPLDYLLQLRRAAADSARSLPFFTFYPEEAPAGRRFVTLSRVALYDDAGAVVEREVSDLGTILALARPEAVEQNWPFMAHAPALEVIGERVVVEEDGKDARLVVESRTDLWFPEVLGLIDNTGPLGPPSLENRALACRHTPRLNEFVGTVRAAVEEAGGGWSTPSPEGIASRYAPWVGTNGIALA